MAHGLILGITESGKTTLAKRLAAEFRKRSVPVIVLDPLNDTWDADYQTDDNADFLNVFWNSQGCAAFIDESGDAVGQYDKLMTKTATKGRHWGHSVFYITQRGAQISRTVRDQCSRLFLFATALPDAKVHSAEWNAPELMDAHTLQRGEYFNVSRFGPSRRERLF